MGEVGLIVAQDVDGKHGVLELQKHVSPMALVNNDRNERWVGRDGRKSRNGQAMDLIAHPHGHDGHS